MIIPEDKWFYFASGRRASSIEELKAVLDGMDEAEFRHHANNEKNDFANWVEGVLGEAKLAHDMMEVSDKDGMIIILEHFLNKNYRKEEPKKELKRVIIPPEKKLSLEPEKELSEKEIKNLVEEAMQVFETHEEKEKIAEKEEETPEGEDSWEEKHKPELLEKTKPPEQHYRFVVKEFIYGFILGLIFGLIMLGIIFNLKGA